MYKGEKEELYYFDFIDIVLIASNIISINLMWE